MIIEVLLNVDDHCFEVFEGKVCFSQRLIKRFLDIFEKPLVHTSPPRGFGKVKLPSYILLAQVILEPPTSSYLFDPIYCSFKHLNIVRNDQLSLVLLAINRFNFR